MVYRGKRNAGGRSSQDGSNQSRNGNKKTTPKKWSAPTANHHDVAFSSGTTAKDAAGFTDTVRVLARHVSTSSTSKHGPVLALAMTDLQEPVYFELTRPVRKYVCNSDTTGATIADVLSHRSCRFKVDRRLKVGHRQRQHRAVLVR